MRFRRGAYALNIVTGCFYRWRTHSKKQNSLRKRLEKFTSKKETYTRVAIFSELKKYAIYRILKNNKDYGKIQAVRGICQKIHLKKWHSLTCEAVKQRELLSGVIASKNSALKTSIFTLLRDSTVLNREKRKQKHRAFKFSVRKVKQRNFELLKFSVEKSKFLNKCSESLSKKHNLLLKQKYIADWQFVADSTIKFEQFLNTRRAKELLKLMRAYSALSKNTRAMKREGFYFEREKRAARFLQALREGVARCRQSKKQLLKYFTRKVKENKKKGFTTWRRKIRRGDSLG